MLQIDSQAILPELYYTVMSGKKLPAYDVCGGCTDYSCIMPITVMVVSLAVRAFENFELLVDSNLLLLGKTAGTYLCEGQILKSEFRWRFSNPRVGYR